MFAGVSLRMGMLGQATCGCFGAVKATPWQAFGLDVAVLVLLGFVLPKLSGFREIDWGGLMRASLVAAGAVAIFFVLGAVAFAFDGSVDGALARLRGESLSFRPRVLDFGAVGGGQDVRTTLELVNRTKKPVQIYGGTSDCSCITTADLPITISPGEARGISVTIRLPNKAGVFARKAFLHTDCPDVRLAVFNLTGTITPSEDGSGG